MKHEDVLKIAHFTRLHEKEFDPRMAIWQAMKQFGVNDKDPEKAEIFKDVAREVALQRSEERETKAVMAAEKKAAMFRDAAANQARHPEEAHRNF
jgi:hypothetical protein